MEIVITAMTKVNNMVCLAGLNLEDYTWVRPLWRYSAGVWPGVNYYQSDALIEVGDVVRLKDPQPCPNWAHYEAQFLQLLEQRNTKELWANRFQQSARVCLLCSEHEPEYCHRRLVAEYIERHFSNTTVQHLY